MKNERGNSSAGEQMQNLIIEKAPKFIESIYGNDNKLKKVLQTMQMTIRFRLKFDKHKFRSEVFLNVQVILYNVQKISNSCKRAWATPSCKNLFCLRYTSIEI